MHNQHGRNCFYIVSIENCFELQKPRTIVGNIDKDIT
jgi:hypothetical protein